MVPTVPVSQFDEYGESLVIAPPSAFRSKWLKDSKNTEQDFVQDGCYEGTEEETVNDRGFVISDHADWTGLIKTIVE